MAFVGVEENVVNVKSVLSDLAFIYRIMKHNQFLVTFNIIYVAWLVGSQVILGGYWAV